jgi:phosphoribosylformylglycinamidine cyclo-ligase
MSLYNQRGVSAQKEEVHAATRHLSAGLFPRAFCKVYPDYLGGSDDWVNVMHADGAGTKSILAYLYWKETGDVSVWKGIAQDAIVMNLDDLLCVGIYDQLVFNSTIDRNKHLIPGAVLEAIIHGSQELFESLAGFGVHIHYLGGETADVGDVVRTVAVNGTMTARWPKAKIISNENIQPGDVIVGIASDGQASYENSYNSGIGSNGLTSARHDVLGKYYALEHPESFDFNTNPDVVYIGKYRMTSPLPEHFGLPDTLNVGKLLLSPTRTYAPLVRQLLEEKFDAIHGVIHSSGGGQTKCMKYMPDGVQVVKDNMFEPSPIFKIIQESSGASNREMYEVFNMGCRLEIYTSEADADAIVAMARTYDLDARVIGRVEASPKKELKLVLDDETIIYA